MKGWTFNDNVVRKYSADGTQLAEYTMEANYWFPEVFVFPDTEDPVLADFKAINLGVGEQTEADVDVTDADTPSSSAWRTSRTTAWLRSA